MPRLMRGHIAALRDGGYSRFTIQSVQGQEAAIGPG